MMLKSFRTSLVMFLSLTILTGLAYPGLVTAIANLVFPAQSQGSLLVSDAGKIQGSALIGQSFSDPKYFWGRLSATGPVPYNAAASSGSNLGAANPALMDAAKVRIAALKSADPDNQSPIPVDLVTASASGLDPDISVEAAQYQAGRVARLRGLNRNQIQKLMEQNTSGRQLGFLGEPRVNVLKLNLALDKISRK